MEPSLQEAGCVIGVCGFVRATRRNTIRAYKGWCFRRLTGFRVSTAITMVSAPPQATSVQKEQQRAVYVSGTEAGTLGAGLLTVVSRKPQNSTTKPSARSTQKLPANAP